MQPPNLIKEECCNGIEVLVEIPNIKLYELNNLMIEHPCLLGLKWVDNKVYGVVAEIKQ